MQRERHYWELDWNTPFDPVFGPPITLDTGMVLWRGFDDAYPALSNRPAYFGSYDIANRYANKPGHRMGCFITTRPLKIIDIRFLCVLLERFIQMYRDEKYIDDFGPVILAFGLCSLNHQITMMRTRFRDILSTPQGSYQETGIRALTRMIQPNGLIEAKGVRIAETINDGAAMTFLKSFCRRHFDGYIAPTTYTPYHHDANGILHAELVLFDPLGSSIAQIPYQRSKDSRSGQPRDQLILGQSILRLPVKTNTLADLLRIHRYQFAEIEVTVQQRPLGMRWFHGGGQAPHRLDEYAQWVEETNGGKEFDQMHQRAGQRWAKKFKLLDPNAPHPDAPVSPWLTCEQHNISSWD